MNRTVVITIGVVLAIAIALVVIWLLLVSSRSVQEVPVSENTNTGGSQQQGPTGPTADNVPLSTEATSNSIAIQNMAFSPANVTVKRGTTVTWTNYDDTGHNVVSDDGAPEGGPPKMAPLFTKGGAFSFYYDVVGVFPYHCSAHPDMQGTVTVIE
jgi:plastocyanin